MTDLKPFKTGFVEGEEVLAIFRRHWIYMAPGLLVIVCIFILMGFLFLIPLTEDSILTQRDINLLLLGAVSLSLAIGSRAYIQWRYNIYQITNKRISNLTITNSFAFNIRESVFELVKSVEEKRSSFMGSLFNYGHINISTEMFGHSIFRIRYVKNPEKIMNIIQQHTVRIHEND